MTDKATKETVARLKAYAECFKKKMDNEFGQLTRKIIRESIVDKMVRNYFDRMHVTVEIKDEDGRTLGG